MRWRGPVLDLLRHGSQIKTKTVLFAFDLLELDGEDLRPMPIEVRKRKLAKSCERRHQAAAVRAPSRRRVEIFEHACRLGCEGIVSKRVGSRYVSGRTDNWIKVKNPAAPAVRREAEEDWGKKRWRARWKATRIMIFGPKGDGTYGRIQDSRRRSDGDLNPENRGRSNSVLSRAHALRTVRAGRCFSVQ